MARLGILAGQGSLPGLLAAAHPKALFGHFAGLAVELPGTEAVELSYERFGEMFAALHAAGVTDVVFAGGLARPGLNPANFDAKMRELAPGFLAAMQGGDDGLLRAVIAAFEAEGFAVRGAHELVPGLTAEPGRLAGPSPSGGDLVDAARARAILDALGPLDVGQGAVVADGQALGVETAQGTDAMLRFVAETPARLRQNARGVLVKAPKQGQDLRIDMPAIGPATIAAAAAAGLAGIVIEAGRVLLLDRDATCGAADEAGLFLIAEAAG
ncbi:MAG: UDP-2,3-diacylglucosamine diphosphatase LpxI [Rhodobacter sp.]|nr:UDP-2,3-diacylglucosamine diphosphatase LpxI [Rhodobacter sp.]